jgi:hypothetical protein
MKYSLLILPFLASLASAQDDPWKGLNKGDRVQIMFRSGNTILGALTNKPADPRLPKGPIDFSTVSEVTIDVSLEYPGLNGTMTIPKKEIKEIRKLGNLDSQTMKRIQDEIERISKQAAEDEKSRKAAEGERDKLAAAAREAADKERKEKEGDEEKGKKLLNDYNDLQKGKELLKRFPPDKYGPQTFKDMADMALRKQPIPPDMVEFTDGETQRLWNLALNASKEDKKDQEKKEEKKEPDKKDKDKEKVEEKKQ